MKKNNKKGFTLVELVIVVAVMAVLVAVAIPTVKSITGTAKSTVADTNARTIESIIKLAEAEKSKNGDTIQVLTEAEVDDALEAAKLGITEGTFAYNTTKGTVVAGTASTDEYEIKFVKTIPQGGTEDDLITVTKKTASGGSTASTGT